MDPLNLANKSSAGSLASVKLANSDLGSTPKESIFNSAIESLVQDGYYSFIEYINSQGIVSLDKLVVISPNMHFLYDKNEMEGVEAILLMKGLNCIKDIRGFLDSVALVLPASAKLFGCFIDHNDNRKDLLKIHQTGRHNLGFNELVENGIHSTNPLFDRFLDLLDSRVFRRLSVENVRRLCNASGLTIVNIKKQDGVTYFHARKN